MFLSDKPGRLFVPRMCIGNCFGGRNLWNPPYLKVSIVFFHYKISSTNMEGLRELHGMVVVPAGRDYAWILLLLR